MVTSSVGFWRRLVACLLDGVFIGIPLAIISFLITGGWKGDIFTHLIRLFYILLLPILWSGYTVGKRIVGIRIVKVEGSLVGIGAMFLRTIVASLVYAFTLGIGLVVSAFMVGIRDDKRSIHDLIAGTYVTSEKPE